MNLADAKALLPEIRTVLELASPEWAVSYDASTGQSQVCGRDVMTGEVYPIATMEKAISHDDRELITKALVYLRAAIQLRDEAVRAYKELAQPSQEPTKNEPKPLSTIVAIKCSTDLAFARYLQECHGLEDASNSERIKTRLRSVLAIQSLKELNEDPSAIQAWQDLLRNFKAWLRAA